MALNSVAVLFHTEKERARELASETVGRLEEKGVEVLLARDEAPAIGRAELGRTLDACSRADLLLVFGGDGTILRAARQAGLSGIPVLGVNLGRFGFLSATDPEHLPDLLDDVHKGKVRSTPRMLLEYVVYKGDQKVGSGLALNEVVVTRAAERRV